MNAPITAYNNFFIIPSASLSASYYSERWREEGGHLSE
jgi:hypothetical protein